MDPTNLDGSDAADRAARFRTLPEHVRLEDTIAAQDTDGPDPTTWQDPCRELLLSAAWLALG